MVRNTRLSEYIKYYSDKRLLSIFMFGISSGFPWVLIGSVMSAWLSDEGLSRSMIGLFGIVFGVYSINFLWSPLVDRLSIPLFTTKLGQRRGWILCCQIITAFATISLALITLKEQLFIAALLCFIIALSSATQDIAIDAFRIDSLDESESEKITAAATMATSGWWTGYALLGALPFFLVDFLNINWSQMYVILAMIFLIMITITLVAKEPATNRKQIQQQLQSNYQKRLGTIGTSRLNKLIAWLAVTVVEPFKSFFTKHGLKMALTLLSFIFLFKIGEAFLGRMSIVFYKEIGFSNTQIGQYSKLGSGAITIIFAFLGSIFNHKYGIVKGLFISGVAMAVSNLMFAVIAIEGPKEYLYALAILVDGFTQAWSLVAMVTFISMLCDRAFSATHYALLASLSSLGRTLVSSYSGILIDDWLHGNWVLFFVITAIMVIPSLLLLYFIRNELYEIESNFHSRRK